MDAEPSQAPTAAGAWWRRVAWAAFLLGALLRIYPLWHPYLQPELEVPTGTAIAEIVRHDWRPLSLFHGTAFIYTLRVAYTAVYALGYLTGRFKDRLDLLAAFVRDPSPFFVAGRLIVLAASLLALVLAGRTAGVVAGPPAAACAILLLAVSFIHVRESHYVWYDVPAGTAVTLATLLGMRAVRSGRRRDLVATAVCGGVALATKHSVFPVVVPVAVAAALAGEVGVATCLRRLAGAAAVALGAYAIVCPYSFLDFRGFLTAAWFTAGATQGLVGSFALPFRTLWWIVIGPAATGLALVGIAAALRARPREALVLIAFPLAYAAVLAGQGRLHARYLAPAAPLVAALAGIGTAAIGRLASPRHAAAATTLVLAAATAIPTVRATEYVRLLGRDDTRALAGEWIRTHVPPGTRITLPSANGHPNPLLPLDDTTVRIAWRPWADELLARGVVDRAATYPRRYLGGVFGGFGPDWQPRDRYVVMTHHPVVVRSAEPPDTYRERIEAAGGRQVAEFRGFDEPLEGVVYDPIDANYVPLVGFDRILRPGPNLTVWELPVPGAAAPPAPAR